MVCSIEGDELGGDAVPGISFAKEFYAKYELKEVLGRGVSSTVRRCIEKATHVEYAVKIIELTQEKDSDEGTDEFRTATKREIDILRMCTEHENIIDLHDSFESDNFIFLVFEICKRGELFDYLTEVVTLSEKRTRHIMRQLLLAVDFVHSKSIVHRDLKPENILLDDNLNVKLSDFGFACVIASDTEMTDLCGTPGYLAPEALKVSMYDNAPAYGRPVDMWASGVIMFTLLSGSPPFWHRKQLIMLRSIMEGQYSFSSPEWADVGDNSKDLISKLLVVEPSKRYTAQQALAHPFFRREERPQEAAFLPRRKFRSWAFVIMAMNRIRLLRLRPPPVNAESARDAPYSLRLFRRWIDGGAFRIYGHWVKRGDNQNRAALFENAIKRDMKPVVEAAVAAATAGGALGGAGGAGERRGSSMGGALLRGAFELSAPQVTVRDRIGQARPGAGPPEGRAGSPADLRGSGAIPPQSAQLAAPRVPKISVTSHEEF